MNRCSHTAPAPARLPLADANTKLAALLTDGGLRLALHIAAPGSPWMRAVRREQESREAQQQLPLIQRN